MRSFDRLSYFLLVLFCGVSCQPSIPSNTFIKTSDLPTIELVKVLSLSDSELDPIFEFTSVISDSDQNIFVVDYPSCQIHIFDRLGQHQTTLGREGSGPGEFRNILYTFVDAKNRLFVSDISMNKSSMFTRQEIDWALYQEYSTGEHRYSVFGADTVASVVLRRSIPENPSVGAYWYRHALAFGDLDESVVSPAVLHIDDRGFLIHESGSMMGIPFGRSTLVASDIYGQVYLLWTETLEIRVLNSRLEVQDTLRIGLTNQVVSKEERTQAIGRLNPMFANLAERYTPQTKPIARSMRVDRKQRIWIETFEKPSYVVLSQNGELLGSVDLPEDETMIHVDANRIYTRRNDEKGSVLTVYEFSIEAKETH